ncbi:hypothetical protein [Asaia bogorensis]|uniref:hypothetical protein n=1 Tax=Asaia bogorensis TaxID=91915 RepID=UPI00285C33C7|nr:hypothetical protein [Asaia bogorensis]MDR6181977.1 hypothetical protein [Asaia bogorensis NBRC 16594]
MANSYADEMKVPMDDPHILDVLLGRLGSPTPTEPGNPPATPKPKRGKKRQSAPVKTRSKAGNRKDPKGGTPQSPVIAVLSDDALRRDLAHATVRCVTFYSLEQPQDLVEQSATFLEALLRLWALRGIDAKAVWREIDHRVQLGNLLNQINRDIPARTDSTRKYWRPSSTKLP